MNTYQAIGQNIDAILLLAVGLYAAMKPEKIVSKKGTNEEVAKRIKTLRICGIVFIVGAPILILGRFFT